ncbi:MAG: trypsin-like peptidase domain-containing protein [Cyanobacteria bacterium J06621_11]
MTRKSLSKKLLVATTISITTLLGTGLLSLHQNNPAAIAQADTEDATEDATGNVELPFNTETDQPSVMPDELDQVDSPLGENSRVIIGRDERVPVLSRQYPWSAMGRLEWQFQGQTISTCTATLVGPSAILTNSHCLLLPLPSEDPSGFTDTFIDDSIYSRFQAAGDEAPKLVFKPSLVDGVALDESDIITFESGWSQSYEGPIDDWAVMQLDQPLGREYGYLGWRNIDFEDTDNAEATTEKLALLGYAGDFPTENLQEFGAPTETAGVDVACGIIGIWPADHPLAGTFAHDCDTNPGASGGPLFAEFNDGGFYIVGLHARSTPLGSNVQLTNGVVTNVVNGGVTVGRWSRAAGAAR